MREWLARIFDWFRRGRLEAELVEELRFHQAQLERDAQSAGTPSPDAAHAARRRLGNVTRIREDARERWSVPWLDHRVQDLRYAIRGLGRSRSFTLVVVLTFALGIGANAAIFSVVDRLLFHLPPLLRAPALTQQVYFSYPFPNAPGQFVLEDVAYPRYMDLASGTRSFARTAAFAEQSLAIGVGVEAREMHVAGVSASLFGFFDAPPALGRYFTSQEDRPPSGTAVAVLSYGMWQSRYGSRADVLGTTVQIGPSVYTVIGVAPKDFVGLWPDEPPVAFIPFSAYAAGLDFHPPGATWWSSYNWQLAGMLVQLKPGVAMEAASADLTSAFLRSWDASAGSDPDPHFRPHPLMASVLTERGPNQTSVAKVAALAGGMALIVLLIACANVANLLLARTLRRRREIAVRLALGVSRLRLLSQLLTESTLLAILGGIGGLLVAQWGGAALRAAFLPPGAEAPVLADTRTLIFVGFAVLVAGVLTGLAPAWQARRVELTSDLKTGAREGTVHRSRMRVTLLVLQGALSLVLLVGAGLFVRSLQHVKQLRLGYDVDPVLVMDLNMRGVKLDSARAVALREHLLTTAQAMPDVENAALSLTVPLRGGRFANIDVPGLDPRVRRTLGDFYLNAVTPDYFATMGTHIVRGRGIGSQDVAGAPGAIVVSSALAKVLWPGEDALGKCVKVEAPAVRRSRPGSPPCTFVVGIAEDIKNTRLSGDPAFYWYLPAAQFHPEQAGLVLRTRSAAAQEGDAIRRVLQKEMPHASYITVTPFADIVGRQMHSWQLGATIFVVFGLLALGLASIGLYGVIAYNVSQRSHEMGVRIALGASTPDVVWLVVRQGVLLAVLGIMIGGAVALASAGWVTPLLFEESPRDPLIYAAVTAAMLVVAVAASFIPARRAARIDPNVALRAE
jgi:predicted permease